MKRNNQLYRKVTKVECFYTNEFVTKSRNRDYHLILTAIPFIGTLKIIGYFMARLKSSHYINVSELGTLSEKPRKKRG